MLLDNRRVKLSEIDDAIGTSSSHLLRTYLKRIPMKVNAIYRVKEIIFWLNISFSWFSSLWLLPDPKHVRIRAILQFLPRANFGFGKKLSDDRRELLDIYRKIETSHRYLPEGCLSVITVHLWNRILSLLQKLWMLRSNFLGWSKSLISTELSPSWNRINQSRAHIVQRKWLKDEILEKCRKK